MKILRRGILIALLAVFAVSFYQVIDTLLEYRSSEKIYENAANTYLKPAKTEAEDAAVPTVDFAALTAMNPDIIGWIDIEGTDISYPLLKGTDNQQYLFQSYEKTYAVAGSIFLDFRCSSDFRDYRTVVYGHNMKNDTMFGALDRYREEAYLSEHSDITILLTDGTVTKYRVTGCGQERTDSETYDLPCRTGNGEKKQLVLSTCTNDSRDDMRFVVKAEEVT